MKRLFFTALVATVAIGGATAQVYAPGGTTPIPCEFGGSSCAIFFGPTGYTDAYPNQSPANEVNLEEYQLEF